MTLVVGHRGSAGHRPENTLASYELAVQQGADAIELDVHLSRDGQVIVIHDETLERTTDREGRVADLTAAEILAADAGFRFSPDGETFPFRDSGLRVPLFAEVLAWLPAGTGLVVEVKALEAVEPAVRMLAEAAVRRAGLATVISFDERAIERSRELDPDLPTGLLLVPFDKVERGLAWAVEHDHLGVYPWDGDLGMDPTPLIAQAAAFGRRLGCYVVNDAERAQQLAACGLWGFVTDLPDVARAAVGRAG